MTMENTWVMTKDRADKKQKVFVLPVRCHIQERAVCDLETEVN